MSSIQGNALTAGTARYTLVAVPDAAPTITIYSDSARTIVAVATAATTATANPTVFGWVYPALAAGTYYLSFGRTFAGVADVDADDTLILVTVSGGVGGEATDLLTLAEAKSVLDIDDTTEDARLAVVISAVSQRLDDLCGPIVQRVVTGEEHTPGHVLWADQHPVASWTTVTEYDSAGNATVLTRDTFATKNAQGYWAWRHDRNTDLFSGRMIRTSGGAAAHFAAVVVLTYVAGRYASTAAVPEKFKQAAAIMVKNQWRMDEPSVGGFDEFTVPQSNFPAFTLPTAVREMLRDEIRETIPVA